MCLLKGMSSKSEINMKSTKRKWTHLIYNSRGVHVYVIPSNFLAKIDLFCLLCLIRVFFARKL